MDGYPSSFRRYWMMEEEDDDTNYSVFDDDEEEEVAMYNHLVHEESSHRHRRRRSDAPPKVIRPRDLPSGHRRIKADYFVPNPVYNDKQFRMRRHVFKRIKEAVKNHDNYFKRKYDATGKQGLSALQKCVASMCILAYGVPVDAVDEYVRIADSTARESLHHFCRAVIYVFGEYYLRAPNPADVARLLEEGEDRGWPGMLGSIDCMHWEWRNCPTTWKGQFTGRGKHPSMILEAVASYDLWIWHAYFGMPGSNNGINVLHRSPYSWLTLGVVQPLCRLQSMEIPITWGTTLPMGFTQSGQPSLRL